MFEVAIVTKDRPHILTTALLGLVSQKLSNYKLTLYDSGQSRAVYDDEQTKAVLDLLAWNYNVEITIKKVVDPLAQGNIAYLKHMALENAKATLLLLDDDAFMMPNTLTRLLNTIDTHQDATYVTPCVLDYKNIMNYPDYSLEKIKVLSDTPDTNVRLYRRYLFDTELTVTTFDGLCVLLNIEHVLSIGGFNFYTEWQGVPCDDSLLARRIDREKFKGYLRTGAEVWHLPQDNREKDYKNFRHTFHQMILKGKFDQIIEKV